MVNAILGASAPSVSAVKAPRFSTSRDWSLSATAREASDLFTLDMPPEYSTADDPAWNPTESVVLSEHFVRNTLYGPGSPVVTHRATPALAEPPLTLVAAPAFDRDPSIRTDAAAALDALHRRERRRVPRGPAPKPSRWPDWLAFFVGALLLAAAFAVLACAARGWHL